MPRKKGNARKVGFFLEEDIIKRIDDLANFEGMGKSDFIELIVTRWDEGINPELKLNSLFKERDNIDSKMKENQFKIKDMTSQITLFNDIKRQKNQRKPQAIKIIGDLLFKNKFEQAEKVSKFWQRETGIPSFQLLIEAKEKTKDL